MYILGINAYHGDVSAVLVKDGRLVAAVEEERFRRVKHWAGFPTESIRACLEIGGITGAEVDHVAVSRDPRAHLLRKARYLLKRRPAVDLVRDRLSNRRKIRRLETPLADALGVTTLPRVHYVEHHPAHLASAFFVSPFSIAAVCAVDGFGDFVSTSTGIGRGNGIEVLDRVFFPHSLGMLYTAVTQYLGFGRYGDEYKVMGLAPYGEPKHVDALRRLVRLHKDGLFELDLSFFRHGSDGVEMKWDDGSPTLGRVFTSELEDLLGPARTADEEVAQFHMDVAHSVQQVYEEAFLHVLNGLWKKTRLPHLALAGGCAMNSVANGKIRAHTPFEHVYIQPAAGDNGTALGAAYWVWHRLGGARRFVMDHAYWGPSYASGATETLVSDRLAGHSGSRQRSASNSLPYLALNSSDVSRPGMENISDPEAEMGGDGRAAPPAVPASLPQSTPHGIRQSASQATEQNAQRKAPHPPEFDTCTYGSTAATCRAVAELIAGGAVVGWFNGRMEWGARALGNRSILADPRRHDVRELINEKIKFRELFRPFAPAVLEESLEEYFTDAAPDAFMQQVYPVWPEKRDVIPAVTHVDGSGRVQSVRASANPAFHRLIAEFEKLTGVPVLLNTSFNENEPIVNTPEEAVDCFLRTRMDALVIGNLVVRRLPVATPESDTEEFDQEITGSRSRAA